MADYDNVVASLGDNGLAWSELAVGDNHVFVVPHTGAHALGPFDKRSGDSFFWLNPAFANSQAFKDLVDRRDWNMGGLRFWIAPEIRFGVKDRTKYWESLTVPGGMDPAEHQATVTDGALQLECDMALRSFNPEEGVKELSVLRRLRATPDPLAAVPAAAGLAADYFGCVHESSIAQKHRDGIPAEAWNLIQVKGGGVALVPTTGAFAYEDYYEPLEPSHFTERGSLARLTLDGKKRFKIGVRSYCHFGRIAHRRETDDGVELIVCSYHNDPGAWYAEQPEAGYDTRGLSMHFYNDGGMFGGFGELEANGRTLGLNGYPDVSVDQFSIWCYRADAKTIDAIAALFVGGGE